MRWMLSSIWVFRSGSINANWMNKTFPEIVRVCGVTHVTPYFQRTSTFECREHSFTLRRTELVCHTAKIIFYEKSCEFEERRDDRRIIKIEWKCEIRMRAWTVAIAIERYVVWMRMNSVFTVWAQLFYVSTSTELFIVNFANISRSFSLRSVSTEELFYLFMRVSTVDERMRTPSFDRIDWHILNLKFRISLCVVHICDSSQLFAVSLLSLDGFFCMQSTFGYQRFHVIPVENYVKLRFTFPFAIAICAYVDTANCVGIQFSFRLWHGYGYFTRIVMLLRQSNDEGDMAVMTNIHNQTPLHLELWLLKRLLRLSSIWPLHAM